MSAEIINRKVEKENAMKNSNRFFENRDCPYYPCHKGLEQMNCMFCYCPLYSYEECPGSYQWVESGKGKVKDCSNCVFPHRAENYDAVLGWMK